MEEDNTQKNKHVFNIEAAPSHLFNNLAMDHKWLYFIHNSESKPRIISINKSYLDVNNNDENKKICSLPLSVNETNEMLIAKVITFNDNISYIAVGLYGGFKLWSRDGSRLLFQIPAKTQQTKPYAFLSITEYQMNSNEQHGKYDSILCGDNYGQLFLVSGQLSKWKSKLIYNNNNTMGITSIAATTNGQYVGLTFDKNSIALITINNTEMKNNVPIKENALALTSGIVTSNTNENNQYFCCGFINGEIKVYDFITNTALFCIHSNLRIINALTTYKNNIFSVGDDGSLNVWSVDFDSMEFALKCNEVYDDRMLVGIVYDETSKRIFSTAYDFNELICLTNIDL